MLQSRATSLVTNKALTPPAHHTAPQKEKAAPMESSHPVPSIPSKSMSNPPKKKKKEKLISQIFIPRLSLRITCISSRTANSWFNMLKAKKLEDPLCPHLWKTKTSIRRLINYYNGMEKPSIREGTEKLHQGTEYCSHQKAWWRCFSAVK